MIDKTHHSLLPLWVQDELKKAHRQASRHPLGSFEHSKIIDSAIARIKHAIPGWFRDDGICRGRI